MCWGQGSVGIKESLRGLCQCGKRGDGRGWSQEVHPPAGPKERGAAHEKGAEPQVKGLGCRARRSPGPWRAGLRKRAQLTSDLPRLWPPVCQLGALLWAQHTQPCGCSVHQRGGHSVRRGPGVGGEWLPHVTGKEEVCHRYAPALPLCIPRARTRPGSEPHSLLLLGCRGRGDI